ncbi:MAG: RnfABCDGE type electron transport complex subunit G, partial [Clostridia bacterium]|nr:RnfABCDGE type electron transport complex subunit G [Clostridia bacterium]
SKFLNTLKSIFAKIKNTYKKYADVITPTAVLSIICIVVTLALSGTNLLTKDKITKLAELARKDAMVKLVDADEFVEKTQNLKVDKKNEKITYNLAVKDKKTIAYIFTVDEQGYGGVVSVMTAVDTKGKVIAVDILDASNETPGFGKNVTKESFYTQYSGLKKGITVEKGGKADKDKNQINAVTGATISSTAVTTAVNQAIDFAAQIEAKGENK